MGRGKRTSRRVEQATSSVVNDKIVVIGDMHGQTNVMRQLLIASGAINQNGHKTPNVKAYGIGDLANGVLSSEQDDLECLDLASHLLDGSVLGNHEAALIGLTEFNNMWKLGPVAGRIRSLLMQGFFTPAILVEDILLTHGGVAPGFATGDAKSTYKRIMSLWEKDSSDDIFTAVSSSKRTSNPSPQGGILWLDWDEGRANFSQIVGHTPQAAPARIEGEGFFHLNIDIRGIHGAAAIIVGGKVSNIVVI